VTVDFAGGYQGRMGVGQGLGWVLGSGHPEGVLGVLGDLMGAHMHSGDCVMCNESYPFQAKLNNTSVYCLNSKVHSGMMAVKGVKELNK
jgi:hypothetical protein